MNKEGAKRSDFEIYRISDNPHSLKIVLEKSLGILGVVKKVRELYVIDCQGLSTRVHIDRVEELGDYIEFEVIIPDESQVPTGNEVIAILKEKFHIKDDDLISGAYMDKIIENNQNKF
jgi:adenylate cyclase